jgi:TRAP-type uncharacterized transport system substrate-binding protein
MRRNGNSVACALAAAVALATSGSTLAQDKKFYKFGSFPPGTTPFIVNTSFANAVNKYVPGVEIQISATGAASQHVLLATEGKIDFFMGAPSSYYLMYKQIGRTRRSPTDRRARGRSRSSFPIRSASITS